MTSSGAHRPIKWLGHRKTGCRLDDLVTTKCPVRGLKGKGAVWVSPDPKATIAYRGVTTAGELRHASLKGLVEE